MSTTLAHTPTKAETMLAEQFALALPGLPGAAPAIKQRRTEAFDLIRTGGLPSRRNESWHYTDLRARMAEAALPMLSLPQVDPKVGVTRKDPFAESVPLQIQIVRTAKFVGGTVPAGVELVSMREALIANHPLLARLGEAMGDDASAMAALNTAFFTDGFILHVGKGVKLTEPMRVCARFTLENARAGFARGIIICEEDSELSMVMSQVGPDGVAYQTNAVIEFFLADRAKLDFVRVNMAGDEAQSLTGTAAVVGAQCELNVFAMVAGGDLSRHEIHVRGVGAESKIGLRGVSLLRRRQHADMTLVVDHRAPGCESRELFRSVVDGEATGVFQGKIMVRREAQKTDGQMASNAVLLSDDATMNNKPELEIFADDVVCAHGATCGALDEDLLFYLQARGLPRKEAEALMLQAFCGEAMETVRNEKVREALNGLVADWLKARS